MSSKISTAAGYHVVTQGKQIAHQRERDREIFEFKTLSEINNLPAWLTVPFTAETKKHDGVTLQVFAKKQQLIERSDAIAVNFQAPLLYKGVHVPVSTRSRYVSSFSLFVAEDSGDI